MDGEVGSTAQLQDRQGHSATLDKEKSMVLRKIMLTAGAATLMSTPAWALPAQGHGKGHRPSDVPAGPPSSTPNNKDHGHSGEKGSHGKSHHCVAHKVGYVASGTLVKQTLTKNEDGTYSGELEVAVKRTNHHASADRGMTVDYQLSKARLVLGVEDVNKDGKVNLEDVAAGDRVHLVGKITFLPRKCSETQFKAEKTIRQVVIGAPAPATHAGTKS
jgi:hypothetical protein